MKDRNNHFLIKESTNSVDNINEVLPELSNFSPEEMAYLWLSLDHISTVHIVSPQDELQSVSSLISQYLLSVPVRSREILTKRVFATGKPVTLEKLGQGLGVTRERVRQIEAIEVRRLKKLSKEEFMPLCDRAKELRSLLGVGVPLHHSVLSRALDILVADPGCSSENSIEFSKALLLWLAGPYKERHGWLLAEKNLKKSTLIGILEKRNHRGVIAKNEIEKVLFDFGFIEEFHSCWIEQLRKLVQIDEGYLHLNGNVTDKMEALIKYYEKPIAIEDVSDLLGKFSTRSVRQRLIDHPGFWRINKQCKFVMAGTPGYDEYTGIIDEIVQEIESRGGEALYDQLVEKVSRVYGVKENSVIAYLNTPRFIKDKNGIVRLRSTDLGIEVKTDIEKTAACYKNNDGFWMWRVLVDKDIVRGSGKLVPKSFAQEVGCDIGSKIEVSTTEGPLTFSWPVTSTSGASIGSLRAAVESCNAQVGDYLFVCSSSSVMYFRRLQKERLDSTSNALISLALFVGTEVQPVDDNSALKAIATSLNVKERDEDDLREGIRRNFNARGESELAEEIPKPSLSMNEYINSMEKLFN